MPDDLSLVIPTEHGSVELALVRVNIFSDGFTTTSSSGEADYGSAIGGHYRGIVANQPNTIAAISVFAEEIMGFISDDNGNHVLGRVAATGAAHIYYLDVDMITPPMLSCLTTSEGGEHSKGRFKPQGTLKSTKCVDLYWEVNYDVFQDKGSNTTSYITGLFNQHATLFDNDGVTVLLSELHIWNSASPYTATNTGALLDQFQDYRNSFNGDLANLLGYGGGGGIAAGFDGLCNGSVDERMCYSGITGNYGVVPTYSASVMVVTHEEGHLLGSRHTHACVWNGNNTAIDGCGPTAGYSDTGSTCAIGPIPAGGGTIMSYCHLNAVGINFNLGFGPQPGAVILSSVNTQPCITSCGGSACDDELPNNSSGNAEPLQVETDYDFCLQQHDPGDWFAFYVTQGGSLDITIDNISNPLINFALYGAGETLIAQDLSGTTSPKFFTECWTGSNFCSVVYLRVWPDVVFTNTVRTYSVHSDWQPGATCFTSLMPPSYSATASPSTICSGLSTTLTASPGGAVEYEWHSAANGGGAVIGTTASLVVSPTATTTYSVVISPTCDSNDDITINVMVTVLASPTANAGANQTISAGGSTTLAGSGGSTYSWSPTSSLSNPNIWNPIASPTVTTTYTLTVTNANGCTDTDQVTITVTGTGGGAPANDNPCSATPLTVSSSCSYITGTNVGATGSSVPTPSTCAASSTSSNPSGNYQGGDVWYSAVVPSSGQLIIQTQIQSSVTDLVIVAYTGASCSSLTQLACNDDQVPGSNYMPRLSLSGLTVGQTIRFRIYDFGNNNFGNFGVCVYNPGGGSSSGRDLISWITAVSDNTVEQGDSISVTYKVKNIGTLNVTTPFLSAVYLSSDPNYSSGSDELVDGSIEAFISLNAGQEFTATNTVTIPNEPDGNYYLVSFADAASVVGETNEANNFGFWAIQLGNLVPDGPNLEVDDVDVVPNVGLAPGQEVDVEVRLENTGTEDSDNCDVLVVFDLNDNHQYDAGVDPVLESIIFPSLEPGEDDTRTRDVLLPTNIPSTGGYDIIAVADINNECNETNESDQEGSEEVQISTLTPAGPDLVPALDWIELPPPSNVQVSSQDLCVTSGYDIFFSVTNVGNLNSTGGLGNVDTRVYISSDPVISGNDYIWSLKFHSSGSWNVGQVRSYHDNDTFDGQSPGPAYMIISTDEDHVLPETNEANNIIVVPIYITSCGIGLPDLTGTLDFYTPYSSALGDTITTEVTVWNQGTAPAPPSRVGLYVSDDQQYDGSGGLGLQDYRLENLGYINILDSLFPGDTLQLAITGSSQGLSSTGLKYLIMAVDDNTDINELDRSNNNITAPIEITSVACYYNFEWEQIDSGYVDYQALNSFPIYVNTEDGCTWTVTEAVSWANGASILHDGDAPYFVSIQENPYPVERTMALQLNGTPLTDIVQGPRPCQLVGDSLRPHLTAVITQASCNQSNGAIQVSGTGHYLPLEYVWSTAETTANVESLPPGTYDLTITDAVGCTLDTTFTITNTGSACTPVQLHANLEGPFNGTNMNDALRQAGLIPTTEPYTALGLNVGSGGGETVGVDRLAVVGDSAVVDWVLVELRSSADPAIILETRSALLLRNGAIVSSVGSHPLVFGYASGSFNLAVRHRNHLGVMTGAPVAFTGSLVTVDFRSTSTGTWGTEAQKTIGSGRAMWSGNTNGDDVLKYTGSGNDRDPILVRIGGIIPTNTVFGYFIEDCNLNGVVQYTGSLNDRDPILVNIGGVIPTNTRQEQLP